MLLCVSRFPGSSIRSSVTQRAIAGSLASKYFVCEPSHEETNDLSLRPGPTQTDLYSHRSRLEAGKFRFEKERDCTIRVAKTKALISCAVTAQLICVFVFAYANCWCYHVSHVFLGLPYGLLSLREL